MKRINDINELKKTNGGFGWIKGAAKTAKSAHSLAKASGDTSVRVIINSYTAISTCGGSESVESVDKNGFVCKG